MPLAPGQTDRDGYNLSDESTRIYAEMLSAHIEAIYVEFLSMSSSDEEVTNLTKNHVVYKIDFAKPILGFEGARLAMDVSFDSEYSHGRDGREALFQQGRLNLKPVRYKEASISSACTFQLSVMKGLTLGLLLSTLMSHGLQFFCFVIIRDRYFGCRDFMVQSFLLFEKHGFIRRNILCSHDNSPPTPFLSIIDNLGMRWDEGRAEASPIDMGSFLQYWRTESPAVPYDGSQRSREIERIVRQM